jgi:prolipoprotein diacylglyceryltransferase
MRQIIVDFGVLHLFGLSIPLRIYGYGLMMVLGFLIGIALAQWRARKAGGNPEVIPALGILALIGGVLGARLAYVIQDWRQFLRAANPLTAMLDVTSGGLIFFGGVAGATIVVLLYMRVKHLPLRRYLDILSVSLMVGLAFGRAGCFLNGCCYGGACKEDWALATRFPMFSQPLVRLGESAGPFSIATEGPSPVFWSQWENQALRPNVDVDERLVNFRRRDTSGLPLLHPPRYLHGPLERDQLDVALGSAASAQLQFDKLAGPMGWVGPSQWSEGLKSGKEFLRGGEFWDEAETYASPRQGLLTFPEAWNYLQDRKAMLASRFGGGDGNLSGEARKEADQYLRADLFSLAAAQKSLPVKPAQLLALVNALVIAGILWGFYGLRWREGQVFALLMVLYPITRIVEEAIRDDNPHNLRQFVFTHNQVESMIIILGALLLWLGLRRLSPSVGRGVCAAPGLVEASASSRPPRNRTDKPDSRKGN